MNIKTKYSALALTALSLFFTGQASANLLLNPGFEADDAGAAPAVYGEVADWVEFNTTGVTKSQALPDSDGDQSLRIAPNAPTGTGHGIVRQEFSASANEIYTLSGWVMHPEGEALTGGRVAELRIQWRNASGTLINQEIATVLDKNSPTDEWIYVEIANFQLPDNVNIAEVWPTIIVRNGDETGGGAAYFDEMSFELVTSIELPGDLDGDGFVGLNDLDIILNSWNQTVSSGAPADPSGDGFVGLDDLDVVLNNWNNGTPSAAAAVVPEPTILSLLTISGLAIARRK